MGTTTFEEPIRIISNNKPMMESVAKELIKEKVLTKHISYIQNH